MAAVAAAAPLLGVAHPALPRLASRALASAAALAAVPALGLVVGLVQGDFSLRFVAQHSASTVPLPYRLAAFWSEPPGATLFGALVLGAAAFAVMSRGVRRGVAQPVAPLVLAVGLTALLVLSAVELPFERLPLDVHDGSGPAPHVQTPAGALYPALAIAGNALLLVPLALALDAWWRRDDAGAAAVPFLAPLWTLLTVAGGFGAWLALRVPSAPLAAAPQQLLVEVLLPWVACSAALLGLRRRVSPPGSGALALLAVGSLAVLLALTGLRMQRAYDVTLGAGAARSVDDAFGAEWRLQHQGVSAFRSGNRDVVALTLEATRDGSARLLVPALHHFVDGEGHPLGQAAPVMAAARSVRQDVTAQLVSTDNADAAELRVTFQPFALWLWIGIGLLAAAGLWLSLRRSAAAA